MTNLQELIERVERASGPDRELDAAIEDFVNPPPSGHPPRWPFSPRSNLDKWTPAYTTSLDAAMTLVPEGCFWALNMSGDGSGFDAMCQDEGPPRWARAATPALALCAASLKARLHTEGEG